MVPPAPGRFLKVALERRTPSARIASIILRAVVSYPPPAPAGTRTSMAFRVGHFGYCQTRFPLKLPWVATLQYRSLPSAPRFAASWPAVAQASP